MTEKIEGILSEYEWTTPIGDAATSRYHGDGETSVRIHGKNIEAPWFVVLQLHVLATALAERDAEIARWAKSLGDCHKALAEARRQEREAIAAYVEKHWGKRYGDITGSVVAAAIRALGDEP